MAQRSQSLAHHWIGQQKNELAPQAFADGVRVRVAEASENHAVDVHDDALHTHPLVSASEGERSRLRASLRAACSRWGMAIGLPASAARKAAFIAMLRMLPP